MKMMNQSNGATKHIDNDYNNDIMMNQQFSISDNDDKDDDPNSMLSHPRDFDEVELGHNKDNDNTNDHDQLPNVEQYKASMGIVSTATKENNVTKNWKLYTSISFILLVFIIVLISFVNTASNKNDNNNVNDNNSSNNSTNNINNDDDNIIIMTNEQKARFRMTIELIHLKGYSRNEALLFHPQKTSWTPQIQAAYWISDVDIMQLHIKPSIEFMQRYVLAVLYYSTNGTNWLDQYNFLTNTNVCEWTKLSTAYINPNEYEKVGIICSIIEPNVIERIYIPNNQLYGILPIELSLLSNNLIEMNFYNNLLYGKIPSSYQHLINLKTLILYQNQIQDTIPQWLNILSNLQIFNIGKNDIYGTIPNNTINQLNSLQIFNCDSCLLTGSIENSLNNMMSLQSLILSNNRINGTISNELFQSWPELIEFDMNSNLLTGTLPSTLLIDNTKLMIIDLHDNLLKGHIINPIYLEYTTLQLQTKFNNTTLRLLSLSNNLLIGRYDYWIYYLKQLHHLDLSFNQFTGIIPKEIGLLTELRYLFLAMNDEYTPGNIPTEIGLLTQIIDISFQKSNRIGKIPTEIGHLHSLVLLDLQNNALTGVIPTQLESLQYTITFILLSDNQLSGTILSDKFINQNNDDGYLNTITLNGNKNITTVPSNICNNEYNIIRIMNVNCTQLDEVSKGYCLSCCTCCEQISSTNTTSSCNNFLYSNIDPNSEYNYVRQFYQLYENDNVIIPIDGINDNEDLVMYNDNYVNGEDPTKDTLLTHNAVDMFGNAGNRSKPWIEYQQDSSYNDAYLEQHLDSFIADDQYIDEIFDENYNITNDVTVMNQNFNDALYADYQEDHRDWNTDVIIEKPIMYYGNNQTQHITNGPAP